MVEKGGRPRWDVPGHIITSWLHHSQGLRSSLESLPMLHGSLKEAQTSPHPPSPELIAGPLPLPTLPPRSQ